MKLRKTTGYLHHYNKVLEKKKVKKEGKKSESIKRRPNAKTKS